MLTHTLGCLGAALSMTLPWPQVLKACVQRRTSGLSATGSALGAALPIGWITYGWLSGVHLQIVTNVVTGTAGLAIMVALLATQPSMRSGRTLRLTAAAAALVVAPVLLSGLATAVPGVRPSHVASLLGLVLAGVSVIAAVPQPLSLLRNPRQELSGLSPARWWMTVGATVSWLLYGLGTGQPAVWASATVGLVSALIVCTVLHLRRERSSVAIAAGAPRWRDSVTTRPIAMAGL
ncbi:SemiSWEET transporter [Actinoplanes sp. KI2]|uniref:SemiSWEET transporter n=1 Tax=Actinoplanes sp. KI2 TaxID=2983315 RepID=UPI0021D56B3E|nr:SemiSWEET transporter [Actinoplanes sp. KI2]MCU7725935.1 SemiSWEET transporter [Actinoplanes sp. KI2]